MYPHRFEILSFPALNWWIADDFLKVSENAWNPNPSPTTTRMIDCLVQRDVLPPLINILTHFPKKIQPSFFECCNVGGPCWNRRLSLRYVADSSSCHWWVGSKIFRANLAIIDLVWFRARNCTSSTCRERCGGTRWVACFSPVHPSFELVQRGTNGHVLTEKVPSNYWTVARIVRHVTGDVRALVTYLR